MKTLLIFGLQIPEPNSTGAGNRMLQLIKLFEENNFYIHFACAQPKTTFSIDLKNIDVKVHEIQLNDSSTKSLLDKIKPDIVLFDRFITEEQFGWVVDEVCPKALKILDTEDLHFLRENREKILKNKNSIKKEYFLSEKAKREIAAIYRCDFTLMISKYEIDLLSIKFNIPESLLLYLPFVFDIQNINQREWLTFNERKHFVSIGNFKHAPNLDMVKHLHQNLGPKIRKDLPQAEWHIYGAYLPKQIEDVHNPGKGIIVKGRATDALKTLQKHRVMLAPVRFGAGLKGKCIDSMRAGTPSVTTSVGSEGIANKEDWSGFVEDRENDFCKSTIQLYSNQNIWQIKQKQCFKILNTNFDLNLFESDFKNNVENALKNLKNIRLHNIVGELLKHHRHRSTKYMSLWIEEKNRKEDFK